MGPIEYDGQIELEEDDWREDEDERESFSAEELIGKTLEEASAFLVPFGYCARATRRNGQPAIVTRDYKPNRINVALRDGKISEVLDVG